MSITLNLTLWLILRKRSELTRSKMGIYDYSGNVHIINGIQRKDMFNMSKSFSLHLIQELKFENQQTLYLTTSNQALYKTFVIVNIVEELVGRPVDACGCVVLTNNHSKEIKRPRDCGAKTEIRAFNCL